MGKSVVRGIGAPTSVGRNSKHGNEGSSSSSQLSHREGFKGGRGRRKHREVKCYAFWYIGHMSWNCPRNQSLGQINVNVAKA